VVWPAQGGAEFQTRFTPKDAHAPSAGRPKREERISMGHLPRTSALLLVLSLRCPETTPAKHSTSGETVSWNVFWRLSQPPGFSREGSGV